MQATPANKMWLPVAPQLSVHVNQMIAKAKHHCVQWSRNGHVDRSLVGCKCLFGAASGHHMTSVGPAEIDEVTLMLPIHGNL